MWRRALPIAVLCTAAATVSAQGPQAVETFDAAWTIVRDSHFDPRMNGVDWNAVQSELRPRAARASTSAELRSVIREMLGRLGQSHFALIPSTSDGPHAIRDSSADPGFDVRLVGREMLVTSVIPGSGGEAAGVRTGWRLLSIDSTAVSELLDTFATGTPERLLNVEAWRLITTRLRGPGKSTVSLTFQDARGATVHASVERRPETGEPVTVGNLPTMRVRVSAERHPTPAGGTAGVVRFNVWMPAVDAAFQRAIDGFRTTTDGIVIDLRGNPGGLAAMLMGISGHFLGERKPLGVMKTRDNELRFVSNPRLVSADGRRVDPFSGPVAILVDALSGSASECFTGGMQALGRARVFGQTSMGQALPALFDRLPNGDVLIHAYGDFVTANGVRLEGRGVVPDEVVPLRREDLLANRDATLEAALRWMDRVRAETRLQSR
jgi:carboxyl-terminal processing protease